jgi:hypothetical protein
MIFDQPKNVDPIVEIVKSIVGCLKNDYSEQFKRSYPDNDSIEFDGKKMDSLRMLKRRLYKLLKPFPVECIVDGYENCISKHPEFMPTVPSIMAYIADEHAKHRQKLKNQDEAKQIESRPAPKQKMTGGDILNMLREALSAPSGPESERLERLKNARESHEALIADHTRRGLIRTGLTTGSLCQKCGRPGTMSNSISGSGNWYCYFHYYQN